MGMEPPKPTATKVVQACEIAVRDKHCTSIEIMDHVLKQSYEHLRKATAITDKDKTLKKLPFRDFKAMVCPEGIKEELRACAGSPTMDTTPTPSQSPSGLTETPDKLEDMHYCIYIIKKHDSSNKLFSNESFETKSCLFNALVM